MKNKKCTHLSSLYELSQTVVIRREEEITKIYHQAPVQTTGQMSLTITACRFRPTPGYSLIRTTRGANASNNQIRMQGMSRRAMQLHATCKYLTRDEITAKSHGLADRELKQVRFLLIIRSTMRMQTYD